MNKLSRRVRAACRKLKQTRISVVRRKARFVNLWLRWILKGVFFRQWSADEPESLSRNRSHDSSLNTGEYPYSSSNPAWDQLAEQLRLAGKNVWHLPAGVFIGGILQRRYRFLLFACKLPLTHFGATELWLMRNTRFFFNSDIGLSGEQRSLKDDLPLDLPSSIIRWWYNSRVIRSKITSLKSAWRIRRIVNRAIPSFLLMHPRMTASRDRASTEKYPHEERI